MFTKITTKEANDICMVLESERVKKPESNNYKNIKPQTGMTVEEAKDFWNELFR